MRQYRYSVTLEQLTDSHDVPSDRKPLQFEAWNHDDIISVVTWIRGRGDFSSQDDAAAFAVGLKLFGEAILANKDNPVLSSFLPKLHQFVKELKAGSSESQRKD